GVITPVSPGSAIITVTSADGTHTAQSEVTVTVGPEGIVPDAIEFAALKDIYDNLGGPNWTNKTNWPSPGNWPASATITQMDSWFGITVANGDLTQIVLDINNLNGTIPESVGNLLGLKRIDFGENDISGTLPESLVALTNLEDLRLNDNHLTGHIPENIGVLSKLKVLDFGRNNLTGTI